MAAVLPSYTHSEKERLVVVVEASKQRQQKKKPLINTQDSTHINSITRFRNNSADYKNKQETKKEKKNEKEEG